MGMIDRFYDAHHVIHARIIGNDFYFITNFHGLVLYHPSSIGIAQFDLTILFEL